jgi:hypothetical protein
LKRFDVLCNRLYRFPKMHPFYFLMILGLSSTTSYFLLEQYTWGKIITSFVLAMFSSEAGAWKLFSDGHSVRSVFVTITFANTINLFLDWVFVAELLYMPRLMALVASVNSTLEYIWQKGKMIVLNGKTETVDVSLPSHYTDQVKETVKGYSHGRLLAVVFFAALLPRALTVVIGGTLIGVFLIKYKKLGWRGWCTLVLGILVKNICVVLFFLIFYKK